MSILLRGGYADDGGRSLVEDKWVLRQTAATPLAPPTAATDGTVGADTSIAGVRAGEGLLEEGDEQYLSTVQAVQRHTTADRGETTASVDNNNNNMTTTDQCGNGEGRTESHNSSSSVTNGYSHSNGQCAKRSRLTIDSGHSNGDADKIL